MFERDGLWRAVRPNPNGSVVGLLHGEVLKLDGLELGFTREDELREPNLEEAIIRNPDAVEPWLVYADWLQERGDPLGQRMVQQRTARTDEHWLEGLWKKDSELQVTWRHGMIERAALREGLGSERGTLRSTLTRLLGLRAAAFLRELIIDLPSDFSRVPSHLEIREQALLLLGQLPPVPTLERLSLGYHLLADGEARPPEIALSDPRFPRLKEGPVFGWPRVALLEVVEARGLVDGSRGGRPGDRLAASGARIELSSGRVALGRIGDANPQTVLCSLDQVGGRVMLSTRDESRSVRVNGNAESPAVFLLPGDLIEIGTHADARVRLRFLVESSSPSP